VAGLSLVNATCKGNYLDGVTAGTLCSLRPPLFINTCHRSASGLYGVLMA